MEDAFTVAETNAADAACMIGDRAPARDHLDLSAGSSNVSP
jgi:hypothetical protein